MSKLLPLHQFHSSNTKTTVRKWVEHWSPKQDTGMLTIALIQHTLQYWVLARQSGTCSCFSCWFRHLLYRWVVRGLVESRGRGARRGTGCRLTFIQNVRGDEGVLWSAHYPGFGLKFPLPILFLVWPFFSLIIAAVASHSHHGSTSFPDQFSERVCDKLFSHDWRHKDIENCIAPTLPGVTNCLPIKYVDETNKKYE